MIAATGGAAAAAAAEAERLRQQEEEEMTPYSPKDLAEAWEFKILRTNRSGFRNPDKLRAILEEEKRGGWVLVEKFDDSRVRLKRPAGTKVVEDDLADGYDPYRTTVGASEGMIALIVALLLLGGLFLSMTLILARKMETPRPLPPQFKPDNRIEKNVGGDGRGVSQEG